MVFYKSFINSLMQQETFMDGSHTYFSWQKCKKKRNTSRFQIFKAPMCLRFCPCFPLLLYPCISIPKYVARVKTHSFCSFAERYFLLIISKNLKNIHRIFLTLPLPSSSFCVSWFIFQLNFGHLDCCHYCLLENSVGLQLLIPKKVLLPVLTLEHHIGFWVVDYTCS